MQELNYHPKGEIKTPLPHTPDITRQGLDWYETAHKLTTHTRKNVNGRSVFPSNLRLDVIFLPAFLEAFC